MANCIEKVLKFQCIEELSEEIIYDVTNDEDIDISVCCKYQQAIDLIKDLLVYPETRIGSINICDTEFCDYNDEYMVDIFCSDGAVCVCCEQAKSEDGYYNCTGDILYIFGNCSSLILSYCDYGKYYEVDILEYDEIDTDICEDDICEDDIENKLYNDVDVVFQSDDDMHGFTASKGDGNSYKSFSLYTTEDISKDEMMKMLTKFDF